MSLSTCRECKKEVSTEARACPHCGAPRPADQNWRGSGFEWRSARQIMGYPLVHVAIGRNAQGRLRVAKGVIAIGQFAVGLVTVAQFGVGVLFGFGQIIFGLTALAQFAGAVIIGVGQFATGYVAIGQMVVAYYGLAQVGLAKFIWSTQRKDAAAVAFFHHLWETLGRFFFG
jgi:hypothetical protein